MSKAERSRKRRISDSENVNNKKMKVSDENDAEIDNKIMIESDITDGDISEQLLSMEKKLAEELGKLTFRVPVEYVYSPLEYAFNIHTLYVQKYCNTTKKILFLGMNPGPWGMSQTGVPFGEINMVKNWLNISGPVGKPAKEQPSRQVNGFDCKRSEVSGKRLWGLFKELSGNPEKFFKHAYVHNYCPIALMDKKGCNITPAELKGKEQEVIHTACNKTLADTIKLLKVEIVIGIGGYAEKRAQLVVKSHELNVKVLCLPHPSPRAANNKNWNEKATKKLSEFGLLEYFTE